MPGPLEGFRVVEVAGWTFVPAAGAMLADLGADVIKVEPPTGDPQRGLQNMLNLGDSGVNPFTEIPNRGKRSVTIDLAHPQGREVLLKLAEKADVFLTSYLPEIREKLRIDVEDLRAVNPNLVYVRGHGWGAEGPMRNVGGYDLAASWASSGFANRLANGGEPPPQPPAFYDLQGANTIAGAVAIALLKRERTGDTSVVDVSLLNVGMWSMAADIVAAPYIGALPVSKRTEPGNPITNWYQTKDGRWLYLVCLQGDRFWPEVCRVIERPELIDDPRFVDAAARFQNKQECVAELDKAFATRTLEEWKKAFDGFSGVWAPVITAVEVHEHVQMEPNGYLPEVTGNSGAPFKLVAVPYRFDGVTPVPTGGCPEVGQHTEEVLMDYGLEWDEISAYRDAGALG